VHALAETTSHVLAGPWTWDMNKKKRDTHSLHLQKLVDRYSQLLQEKTKMMEHVGNQQREQDRGFKRVELVSCLLDFD